jgi:hypothetical protein
MRFSYSVRGIGGAIVGAALSLIGSTAPIQAQESSAVVSVSSANLRANPSLQGAIVGRVVRGDTVLHLASRDDGWSLVRTGRKEAWVRSAFLIRLSAPEAPETTAEGAAPREVEAVAPSSNAAAESVPDKPSADAEGVDPRLAGRGRARASGTSTIPASRDPSRLGAMGGMASGYYFQTFDYLGPAVRAYARVPMRDAPLAMRADLEFSRVSARNLGPGDEHSLTDVRAILGAEFGVPVSDALEVFVVGGLGLSRITDRLRLVDMQFEAQQTDWSLAHDIGLGVKVGRLLILESHFFAGGGAPARLLAGVRL